MIKNLLFIFIFVTLTFAQENKLKIIVGSFTSYELASKGLEQLASNLPQSIFDEQENLGFEIKVRPSGKSFIVVLEPFNNLMTAKKIKALLPNSYKDAFINHYQPLTSDEMKKLIYKDKKTTTKTVETKINTKNIKEEKSHDVKKLPLQKPSDKIEKPKNTQQQKEQNSYNLLLFVIIFLLIAAVSLCVFYILRLKEELSFLKNVVHSKELIIDDLEIKLKAKELSKRVPTYVDINTKALNNYDVIIIDTHIQRAYMASEKINNFCKSVFTCKSWEEAKNLSTPNCMFLIFENPINRLLLGEITESTTAHIIYVSDKNEKHIKEDLLHHQTLSIIKKNHTEEELLKHLASVLED